MRQCFGVWVGVDDEHHHHHHHRESRGAHLGTSSHVHLTPRDLPTHQEHHHMFFKKFSRGVKWTCEKGPKICSAAYRVDHMDPAAIIRVSGRHSTKTTESQAVEIARSQNESGVILGGTPLHSGSRYFQSLLFAL